MKQIAIGIRSYGKALNLLFTRQLLWYLIFPLILNILLYLGGHALLSDFKEYTLKIFAQHFTFQQSDFFMSKYLDTFFAGFIRVIFEVLFFLAFTYFGGYIIMTLLSPVYSTISEKVEYKITGKEYSSNFSQTMKDIFRGIVLNFKNFAIQTALTIVLLFVGFIPVIGWISAVLLFFLNCYFFGFGFMDYTCERKKLSPKQSHKLVRKNKWVAITIGAGFAISLFIPFCGVALSAFVAIWSVIAATKAMNEIEIT